MATKKDPTVIKPRAAPDADTLAALLEKKLEEAKEARDGEFDDLETERDELKKELEEAKDKIAKLEAERDGRARPNPNTSPTASYTAAVEAVVAAAQPLLDDYERATETIVAGHRTAAARAMKFALDSLDIVMARG